MEKKKVIKPTKASEGVKKAKTGRRELSAPLYSFAGESLGTISLPKEIFAVKENPLLVAQAVRVYLSNQRRSKAKVKTRGEIAGSTKKIWRQKGTGRARHGDRYAPIFVGGGSAHGPTGKENWSLKMPKKMKRSALYSSLTAKAKKENIIVVKDLEKMSPKTKTAFSFLKKIEKGRRVLLVTEKEGGENITRAFRNLAGVTIKSYNSLNPYFVLRADLLLFQQKGLESFLHFCQKGKKE